MSRQSKDGADQTQENEKGLKERFQRKVVGTQHRVCLVCWQWTAEMGTAVRGRPVPTQACERQARSD